MKTSVSIVLGLAVFLAGAAGISLAQEAEKKEEVQEEAPADPQPEPTEDDEAGKEADELPPAATDPRAGEVRLPAKAGWRATLVMENGGTGVWTVKCFPVFPIYGSPEIVALDDLGRCHVLVSYSGKWFPRTVLSDGWWLGGLDHGNVDPRIDGAEIYTGSQKGNLYQVVPHESGVLDGRLIAHLPGREIHTVLAGDLDPTSAGAELLLFTRPGALYRVAPTGPHGTFETTHLSDVPGRVRDAVVLEVGEDSAEIACVDRTGRLRILEMTRQGPRWRVIYEAPMGMGRVALRPRHPDDSTVLYATHDDGRVLRHERGERGDWTTEAIFLGPQGPRGLAAGRFSEDPGRETVAVYGYCGKVHLLSRGEEGWAAETIFTSRQAGHWLAPGELDGRNSTDELVLCGFDGRVALLSRPPGYGRRELADPDSGD
jgi:hypothetical protein